MTWAPRRCPSLAFRHGSGAMLDVRILDLIATVVERCEGPGEPGPGHPPAETVRVLAALRRFLREGTPWRGLKATPAQASGSTLRRRLAGWAAVNLLQRVHALLVAMLRGDPDLILDSCSVRAKRGGDLTGRNPTDRGKRGTKYHVAVDGDGVPVACAATAANVNDTLLFERLFLTAFAVVARIRTVFADKGYAAGEPAPGASLRPARLHRPITAPGRLSLPGCRTPRQGILKTASYGKLVADGASRMASKK